MTARRVHRPDGVDAGEQTLDGSSLSWFSDGSVADGEQTLIPIVAPPARPTVHQGQAAERLTSRV